MTKLLGNVLVAVVVVTTLVCCVNGFVQTPNKGSAIHATFLPHGQQKQQQQQQQPHQVRDNKSSFSNSMLWMGDTKEETKVISIDDVAKNLQQVKQEFSEKLAQAKTVQEAEDLRREYLGKKGPINQVMNYMKFLSNEEKPKLGVVINEVKSEVEATMVERMEALEYEQMERDMISQRVDVTMPGLSPFTDVGRRHPLSMVIEKTIDIFTRLGYDTVTDAADSPEIETDYYCFEALNCPKDHPARDMQDTFYLTEDREWMLRTHTSAVQIRQLEKRKPPLRIVSPGRVYRRDDIDATHSLIFHQVEILAIEPRGELDLGHLKGTVEHFLKNMFGPDILIRFRGSYFPFTEPSMEVDVFFRGKWLEVLGCGMVDPRVLEMSGIDPDEFTGFAAGFGVERFAMVIHDITDIREFYKNDARFLRQFPHYYDEGTLSFLKGEPQTDPSNVDPRGEEIPDPPVKSLNELKQRNAQAAVNGDVDLPTKATSSSSAPVTAATPTAVEEKSSPPSSDAIDISKLDIRVGVITKAWEHPEADKLFCEEIDIGEEKPRQIASGLRAYYSSADELVGQRVLVLANLKERKLVGFPSHGMVLCVSSGGTVKFLEPADDAVIGDRVVVAGYTGEPATENQVLKKKMLEAIFPDLTTDANGVPMYKGVPLTTQGGKSCKSNLSDGSIS